MANAKRNEFPLGTVNGKTYVLTLTTCKNEFSGGALISRAQSAEVIHGNMLLIGGLSFWRARVETKPKRVTQKAIDKQHAEALKGIDQLIAQAKQHHSITE